MDLGTEAQKLVWGGAIPLQIHLHDSEITALSPSPPLLVCPFFYTDLFIFFLDFSFHACYCSIDLWLMFLSCGARVECGGSLFCLRVGNLNIWCYISLQFVLNCLIEDARFLSVQKVVTFLHVATISQSFRPPSCMVTVVFVGGT